MEKEKLNDNLVLSAERGHLDPIRYLLKQGADIDSKDCSECRALQLSTGQGHIDCAKSLHQETTKNNAIDIYEAPQC